MTPGASGEETFAVLDDPDALAEAVASALLAHVAARQAQTGTCSVVLTGGSVADRVHRAIATSPARHAVDWDQVHVWWGDERFLPEGDPERNATQARAALLDVLPLAADHVHEIAPATGTTDVDRAAASYADDLAAHAGDSVGPAFDVLMLGIGEDAHVASLFPGHDELTATGGAVAVHDSPKPPDQRVSMTYDTLGNAEEVWFVAAGAGKADAVAAAQQPGEVSEAPARGVRGRVATRWWLDTAAASRLG